MAGLEKSVLLSAACATALAGVAAAVWTLARQSVGGGFVPALALLLALLLLALVIAARSGRGWTALAIVALSGAVSGMLLLGAGRIVAAATGYAILVTTATLTAWAVAHGRLAFPRSR